MKVIVAGPRDFFDAGTVEAAINASGFDISELVHGNATGVDADAGYVARMRGLPVKAFPADWKTHGRAAGPIRNRQMAEYAQALVAVWDGKSRGTENMIEQAKKCMLKVYVHWIKR
ncbi:DUF2493 domain-containing protein [Achromobacter xylosoxidans]|uniref:DUF2493 domain-containing protein n=1 Tax=Alcaligenes xylosoxydans xylosoxydans TaxID=85698 RepID=UPI002E17F176|nr:DUF2493 domain-containing protein [Achromobacter xylosoxidans]